MTSLGFLGFVNLFALLLVYYQQQKIRKDFENFNTLKQTGTFRRQSPPPERAVYGVDIDHLLHNESEGR